LFSSLLGGEADRFVVQDGRSLNGHAPDIGRRRLSGLVSAAFIAGALLRATMATR